VLCQDGTPRPPDRVFVSKWSLPLTLDDRRAADELLSNSGVLRLLESLGSDELPSGDDLVEFAESVQGSSRSAMASIALWSFLRDHYDKYSDTQLGRLRDIKWAISDPDNELRKPRHLLDPGLKFAAIRFPVVTGIATLPQRLRDLLGVTGTLTAEQLLEVADAAAAAEVPLDSFFFNRLDRACASDANAAKIARLADVRVLPVGRQLMRPRELVARSKAAVWGHLKQVVPDDFVVDYPRLAATWHMADGDDELDWREHCDVLTELASRPLTTDLDMQLARQRIESVAEATASGAARTAQLQGRPVVLTRSGLVTPEAALRADLPFAIAEKVRDRLPVALEWDPAIGAYLTALEVRSLRHALDLQPVVDDVRGDDRWGPRLQRQRMNLIRFLRTAPDGFPLALREEWPPIVRTTATLSVRAYFEGELVNEWPASAFLGSHADEFVLYVRGTQANPEDVADAIASQFGVHPGTLELLEAILDAPDVESAARKLDRNNVDPLPPDELEFELVEAELAVPEVETSTVPDAPSARYAPEQPADEEDDPVGQPSPSPPTSAPPIDDYVTTTEDDLPLRPLPPKVRGDDDSLEARGFEIERTWDEPVPELDYADEQEREEDESGRAVVKVILSFYDIANGLIPIRTQDALRLAGGVLPTRVHLFGSDRIVANRSDRHLFLEDGRRLFSEREVLAGTVVRLHASSPGRIEAEIRADEHEITDVWLLEIEDGELVRHRADAVRVRYETDGPLYKSERRWEDLEALYAEAAQSLSCRDLLPRVFEAEPERGFTVDEAWQAVAMYRLFAKATIARILGYQDKAFERREDDRYYLVGRTIKRPQASSAASTSVDRAPKASGAPQPNSADLKRRAQRLARQLASIIQQLGADDVSDLAQILGLKLLEQPIDLAFEQACLALGESGDPLLLDRIVSDAERNPLLATVALSTIERMSAEHVERCAPLLNRLRPRFDASQLARAQALTAQTDSPANAGPAFEVAARLLEAGGDSGALPVALVAAMTQPPPPDPDSDPTSARSHLLDRCALLDRAAVLALDTVEAWDARNEMIATIAAGLPAAGYVDLPRQELLSLVLIVRASDPLEAFDAIVEVAKLHEASPTGAGSARLVYQLAVSAAKTLGISAKATSWARGKAGELQGSPSAQAMQFARECCARLRLQPESVGLTPA